MAQRKCKRALRGINACGTREEVKAFTLVTTTVLFIAHFLISVVAQRELNDWNLFTLAELLLALVGLATMMLLLYKVRFRPAFIPLLPFVQELYSFLASGGDSLANPMELLALYPLALWSIHVFGSRTSSRLTLMVFITFTVSMVYWPIATYLNVNTDAFLHQRVPRFLALCLCHLLFTAMFWHSFYEYKKEIAEHRSVRGQLEASAFVAENLLAAALPPNIAHALLAGQPRESLTGNYTATIAFIHLSDYKEFVTTLRPAKLINRLNSIFSAFDALLENAPNIFKIETIGSTYLVASGLPEENPFHAEDMVQFLLLLQELCDNIHGSHVSLQIGVNSGPVAAGLIGQVRCFYRVFGSTVNIASRMMSHGVKNEIHISPATRDLLTELEAEQRIVVRTRGVVEVKGRGPMTTSFVYKGPHFGQADGPDDSAHYNQWENLNVDSVRRNMTNQDAAEDVLLRLTNVATGVNSQADAKVADMMKNLAVKQQRLSHTRRRVRVRPSGSKRLTKTASADEQGQDSNETKSKDPRMSEIDSSRKLRKHARPDDRNLATAYLKHAASSVPNLPRMSGSDPKTSSGPRWAQAVELTGQAFLDTMYQALESARLSSMKDSRSHPSNSSDPEAKRQQRRQQQQQQLRAVTQQPPLIAVPSDRSLGVTPSFSRQSAKRPATLEGTVEAELGSYHSSDIIRTVEAGSSQDTSHLHRKHERHSHHDDHGDASRPQVVGVSQEETKTEEERTEAVVPVNQVSQAAAPGVVPSASGKLSKSKKFASERNLLVVVDEAPGQKAAPSSKAEASPAVLPAAPGNKASSLPEPSKRRFLPQPSRAERRKSWAQAIQRNATFRNTITQRRPGSVRGGPSRRFSFHGSHVATRKKGSRRLLCCCRCKCKSKARLRVGTLYSRTAFSEAGFFESMGDPDEERSQGVSSHTGARTMLPFDEEGNFQPTALSRSSPRAGAALDSTLNNQEKPNEWLQSQLDGPSRRLLQLNTVAAAERASIHQGHSATQDHSSPPGHERKRRLRHRCSTATTAFFWRFASACSRHFREASVEADFHRSQLRSEVHSMARAFGLGTLWFFSMSLFAFAAYQGNVLRTWPIAAMCVLFLLSFGVMALTSSPIVTAQVSAVGRLRLNALAIAAFALQWVTMMVAFSVTSVPGGNAVTTNGSVDAHQFRKLLDCGYLFLYTVLSQAVSSLYPVFPPFQVGMQLFVGILTPLVVLYAGDMSCVSIITLPWPGRVLGDFPEGTADLRNDVFAGFPPSTAAAMDSNVLLETCTTPVVWGILTSTVAAFLSALFAYRQHRRRRRQFLITKAIEEARNDANLMLENLFPVQVAEAMKEGEAIRPRLHRQVGILWCDLVNFTPLADTMSAKQLMILLNKIFSSFDEICKSRSLWKMDTVGDAYVVLGGLFQSVEEMYFASLIADRRSDISPTKERKDGSTDLYSTFAPSSPASLSPLRRSGHVSVPSKRSDTATEPKRLSVNNTSLVSPSGAAGGSRTFGFSPGTAFSQASYQRGQDTHLTGTRLFRPGLLGSTVSMPEDGGSVSQANSVSDYDNSGGSDKSGGNQSVKHQTLVKLRTHKLRQVLDDMFSIGNEMQEVLDAMNVSIGSNVGMRVGVHCGSVVTGIVGNLRPRFHVFGVSVLRAEEMESTGKRGAVHCSPEARDAYFSSAFSFEPHARPIPSKTATTRIPAKNGQYLQGYFVEPLLRTAKQY